VDAVHTFINIELKLLVDLSFHFDGVSIIHHFTMRDWKIPHGTCAKLAAFIGDIGPYQENDNYPRVEHILKKNY
jgi:hypothetical protein